MMSKTGVIGFVGGETYPNIINIDQGYKQGARLINPNIKILTDYLQDFNNPAKGKEVRVSTDKFWCGLFASRGRHIWSWCY